MPINLLYLAIVIHSASLKAQGLDGLMVPSTDSAYALCQKLLQAHLLDAITPTICYPAAQSDKIYNSHRLLTRYEFALLAIRAERRLKQVLQRDRHLNTSQDIMKKKKLQSYVAKLSSKFQQEIKQMSP